MKVWSAKTTERSVVEFLHCVRERSEARVNAPEALRPELTVNIETAELQRVLDHLLKTGEKQVEVRLVVETT